MMNVRLNLYQIYVEKCIDGFNSNLDKNLIQIQPDLQIKTQVDFMKFEPYDFEKHLLDSYIELKYFDVNNSKIISRIIEYTERLDDKELLRQCHRFFDFMESNYNEQYIENTLE